MSYRRSCILGMHSLSTLTVLLVLALAGDLHQQCLALQPLKDPAAPRDIVQKEVFSSGEGGYYCFRFPAVHFTSKGTLLAFAEGRGQHTRSCANHGDVHLVMRRSTDEGETWSNITVVYTEYPKHTIGIVTCS